MLLVVCKDLPLTLCTGKQFAEYFTVIEEDKRDKDLFKRVLEVRVDQKDKEKILEAKEREKDKSRKPPVCLRKLIRPGDGKTRKKQVLDTVFGMYQNIFPIILCDILF